MSKTQKQRALWSLLAFSVLFIAQSLGYACNAEDIATGGILFAGIGDVELAEIKTLLTDQAKVFEEFKSKNDELLKAKAEGKAVSELTESVNKLGDAMTKLDKEILEIQKKANRPNVGGEQSQDQTDHKKAFGEFLRKGTDNGLKDLEKKAYNSSIGEDGQYLVTPEMDTEITRVVGVISAIGRLARNVTIGTDTFKKVVKVSGMAARRVNPGATGGNTQTPKWAELDWTAYEAEAEPQVFNTHLQDAMYDVETDLANEAAIAFAELAGQEFAAGTGVGGARGITAYDTVDNASYAWGKVGFIVSGAAGAFLPDANNPGDKIIALQHALKSQYRPGAVFVMADSSLAQIRQMKDKSGSFYLWQPDPLAGFGGRLLGSPVEVDDNMPIISANSLSIAYGNFAQGYIVVNRSGTVLIRDNITEKGKTKFNFRRRWGGGIQNFEAIKLMKFST